MVVAPVVVVPPALLRTEVATFADQAAVVLGVLTVGVSHTPTLFD